jgi:hypothetical protein
MSEVDVERRLAALDSIEAPDLWARARSAAPGRSEPPRAERGRWVPILTASILSAASLSFLMATFDRPQQRGDGGDRLDPAALEAAWRADVPDAVAIYDHVEQDRERIYVPTTTGLVAFPKACDGPCEPAWRADLLPGDAPGDPFRTDVAVVAAEGIVAATFDGSVAAFAADCRGDGGVCDPLWTAPKPPKTNGYRDPTIARGTVKVTSSVGEMPQHHVRAVAFDARCRADGGECVPLWTGDLGVGTAYYPTAIVDGVFYQQVGARMLGFESNCRTDGGECDPDFTVHTPANQSTGAGSLYGPVAHGKVLAIVSGDGNVYAYEEHCGDRCRALWRAPVAEFLDTFPALAGDQIVVTDGAGATAFQVDCRRDGGICEPTWTVPLGGYSSVAYADDNVVILVNYAARRTTPLIALDPSCEGDCGPMWNVSLAGDLQGVASDGATVFVAAGGEVAAYPVDCSDPCSAVWRAPVRRGTGSLLIDESRLVVATSRGELGTGGLTLEVFAEAPAG